MEVFFYTIPFCPRGIVAERYLKRALQKRKNLSLVVRRVPAYWKEVRQYGISMVPAIRVGDHALSGLWLTEGDIREFLDSVPEEEKYGLTPHET